MWSAHKNELSAKEIAMTNESSNMKLWPLSRMKKNLILFSACLIVISLLRMTVA
jgi:hypothetical protein